MTPDPAAQRTVTALALAALQNDGDGLATLLLDLDDAEVRNATGAALINLCASFRAILTPAAMQEAINGLQQLAAQHALTEEK